MIRNEFVAKLGDLLHDAKPNLVSCRLATGSDIVMEHFELEFWKELHPHICASAYEEHVVVTCENGYEYFLSVTANSLAAIAEEVFTKMVSK